MGLDYERMGGARWMSWTGGGRALCEAVQQYLDAIQSEPGHFWLSAAAHALEESTRKGYAAALRRLWKRRGEQFGASPRQLLELEIKEMVEVRTRRGTPKSYCPPAGTWTNYIFIPRLWKPGTGGWSSGWPRGGYVASQPWYAARRWNCSSGWWSRLWTWQAPKSWRWPASAWRACCEWERRPECAPLHVGTSGSTVKKGGQASGMWRSDHGHNGGYCSSGKSDDSNTGVPTCPLPSRTRRSYRRDGKRLLEARTSKGTGGMPCVGVERQSCGSGAPASRRSCSREGESPAVSPRITATQRTRGSAKDGCTSRFRCTGWGGGTGGTFQYSSEERPVDSLWARWVRADLRDAAPQRCPGAPASAVGTKRRKRSKSLEPTNATRAEYDNASSSEGEYRFMECDQ